MRNVLCGVEAIIALSATHNNAYTCQVAISGHYQYDYRKYGLEQQMNLFGSTVYTELLVDEGVEVNYIHMQIFQNCIEVRDRANILLPPALTAISHLYSITYCISYQLVFYELSWIFQYSTITCIVKCTYACKFGTATSYNLNS